MLRLVIGRGCSSSQLLAFHDCGMLTFNVTDGHIKFLQHFSTLDEEEKFWTEMHRSHVMLPFRYSLIGKIVCRAADPNKSLQTEAELVFQTVTIYKERGRYL